MDCLSDSQIEDLAAGLLGDVEVARMMAHIDACALCGNRLSECRSNLAVARELREALAVAGSCSQELNATSLPSADRAYLDSLEPESVGWASVPPVGSIPGYDIIRELHRGGQGVVYEAIQLSTQRTVAVKVLLEGPFAGERARWRFEREVKLVARLRHPNIVVIHDSGIARGGYYFAMDYVRGQPLDTHTRLTNLSKRETVRLFAKVSDAVSYAHRLGVIHRDLKPSNILVGEDGEPQVLDFGLAKITGEEMQAARGGLVTEAGQLMGTLRYMSPEQTWGDPEAIDTRTDVYTLGVILYELLTRRPPYGTDGDMAEALKNIRQTDPPRPSHLRREVGRELEAIVLKAMQKDPGRRYQSAGEFRQDLIAWLEGRPVIAKSDSTFYVLRKLAARHYFHTSVVTALIAAIIGFGGITYHALLDAREKSERLAFLNQQVESRNRNLADQFEQIRARQNEHVLGWFLLEWHAGRLEAARGIQKMLRPDFPEYAAMRFLLDDTYTPERLEQELPPSAGALVLFVTGERHLKAGRLGQAREAFLRYTRAHGGIWRPLVAARLEQIDSGPAPPAHTGQGEILKPQERRHEPPT